MRHTPAQHHACSPRRPTHTAVPSRTRTAILFACRHAWRRCVRESPAVVYRHSHCATGLANAGSSATGADLGVKESLVAPILGIVFSIIPFIPLLGLMLSLYGYFGNKAGTKARLIGLIGIFVNLAVALFQVLRM
jgi:hypothetical protein